MTDRQTLLRIRNSRHRVGYQWPTYVTSSSRIRAHQVSELSQMIGSMPKDFNSLRDMSSWLRISRNQDQVTEGLICNLSLLDPGLDSCEALTITGLDKSQNQSRRARIEVLVLLTWRVKVLLIKTTKVEIRVTISSTDSLKGKILSTHNLMRR